MNAPIFPLFAAVVLLAISALPAAFRAELSRKDVIMKRYPRLLAKFKNEVIDCAEYDKIDGELNGDVKKCHEKREKLELEWLELRLA